MIVWMTDVHFDFISELKIKELGEFVAGYGITGVVVTGDISSGTSWKYLLNIFQNALKVPVYFILGNHDYYGFSFEDIDRRAGKFHSSNFHWLTKANVDIDDYTLCGVDNFYDAQYGNLSTRIFLNDFTYIQDFDDRKDKSGPCVSNVARSNEELIKVCRKRADATALILKNNLQAIKNDKIIVATHVPPYPNAAWHAGKQSDNDWLPWFSSKATGDVLDEYAEANPDKSIIVLTGHTHGRGYYRRSANMDVFTGPSEYGKPAIAAMIKSFDDIEVL